MNRAATRRALTTYLGRPVARLLARGGVSPNAVTLFGLLVAGVSALLLALGNLWAGGVVVLVSGVFDLFDGALARETSRATPFGALLDSVVDRFAEVVVLLGLLVYYLDRSSVEGSVLVYLALAASLMVSYVRARAEGLEIECEVGVMTRPERVALLGGGLVLGHWWSTGLLVILGVLAGLALVTTIQRVVHSHGVLRDRE